MARASPDLENIYESEIMARASLDLENYSFADNNMMGQEQW